MQASKHNELSSFYVKVIANLQGKSWGNLQLTATFTGNRSASYLWGVELFLKAVMCF